MMRKSFDQQLEALNTGLIEMGGLIENAISLASSALMEKNVDKAAEATRCDHEVDEKERELEALCLKQSDEIRMGGLALSPKRRQVTADGQEIALTYKEFELLHLLLRNPGLVFTRDQLLSSIWGEDYLGEVRTVDVHIKTLRKKLGPCASLIETVRGVGYKCGGRP